MITLRNIHKSFGQLKVMEDFSIDFEEGQVTCLLGPSGCGKSTILKMLSRLDTKYTGTVVGLDNKKLSYVFQESRLVPWLTVEENLSYVLEGKLPEDILKERIEFFLNKVELTAFRKAYPNTLSGGMKQRVSLARAFSMPHDILLMDEPFQGLDDELKDQLMTLLEELICLDKKTVIMVTHDLQEASRLGDKIIRLIGCPITQSEEIRI